MMKPDDFLTKKSHLETKYDTLILLLLIYCLVSLLILCRFMLIHVVYSTLCQLVVFTMIYK